MKTVHTIVRGDSRKMAETADQSVDLIITSPPYWQLKDYDSPNQIGYDQSYEEYINHLNLVWYECYRVLNSGCKLCVNIGDQFARAAYYGRYKVMPIRTEIIKFCETIGFDYMGAIIWQKKTTSNSTGGGSFMGSYPYPNNGIISIDYEFILIFKKLGEPVRPSKERKEKSKMTQQEWKEFFSGHWNFAGAKQNKHIATFPLELPRRLIKMYSFVGDTVLDPFLGSGTTTEVARALDRNSIGYEINSDFISIVKETLNPNQKNEFTSECFFSEQPPLKCDGSFQRELDQLPYVFKDPHKLTKKVEPHLFQFGSKIGTQNHKPREEYFSVKEVLSPELLILSNDLVVKLVGIKLKKRVEDDAVNFLKSKTKGQKVFFRLEKTEDDQQDYLPVYLYLKNKTFLNAHLIKNGLALSDQGIDHKNRAKFIQLERDYDRKVS